MGACCKPACPSDGSNGGKSDGCGKTCACPSGDVVYSGSCCAPNCPTDGSRGGMSDGCGKTCACAKGSALYMRRLLQAELPERRQPQRDGRRLREDLRLSGQRGGLRRCLLHAELPEQRNLRRVRRLRWHLRLRRRRQVHERPLSGQDLHADLRLRADLQQRPVRRDPVRSGRRSVRVRLLQRRRVLHRRPVHGQHQPRLIFSASPSSPFNLRGRDRSRCRFRSRRDPRRAAGRWNLTRPRS